MMPNGFQYLLFLCFLFGAQNGLALDVTPSGSCTATDYSCQFELRISQTGIGSTTVGVKVEYEACDKAVRVTGSNNDNIIVDKSIPLVDPLNIPLMSVLGACSVDLVLKDYKFRAMSVDITVGWKVGCNFVIGNPSKSGDFGTFNFGIDDECGPLTESGCEGCIANANCGWCPTAGTCIYNEDSTLLPACIPCNATTLRTEEECVDFNNANRGAILQVNYSLALIIIPFLLKLIM